MNHPFWNKIKQRSGFSLTEMLTTVIIMSIVLAGITAGITTARRVYGQIKLAANAQTLMATAISAVNMDLETAENIGGTDAQPDFYSGNRGYQMTYVTGEKDSNNNRTIMVKNSGEGSNTPVPLLTEKTQTKDLQIDLTFEKKPDSNDGYFKYTITISKSDNANSSFEQITRTICVRPIVGDME